VFFLPGKAVRELKNFLFEKAGEALKLKVKHVCLGLGYAGVQLETGHTGLCAVLPWELGHCTIYRKAGTLAGETVETLAKLAESWNPIEAVIGVAALNSIAQLLFDRLAGNYTVASGNLVDALKIEADDSVVIVGGFKPIIPRIKNGAKTVYVLERNPQLRGEDEVLPDSACEEYLPKANVAIITATSLANGTIDRLLELASNVREVALLGPSAPIVADPLFKLGITIVGTMRVKQPELALKILMEGGGTRHLEKACEMVNLRLKTA
jgi:hypothetical protein